MAEVDRRQGELPHDERINAIGLGNKEYCPQNDEDGKHQRINNNELIERIVAARESVADILS